MTSKRYKSDLARGALRMGCYFKPEEAVHILAAAKALGVPISRYLHDCAIACATGDFLPVRRESYEFQQSLISRKKRGHG